jgi:hypothetical protein
VDWNPFYTTMATSTATVMGLLFIAVQLSNDKLNEDDKHPIRGLTFSTFYILLSVFILSVIFLIPSIDQFQRALVLFIGASFGLVRVISSWLPIMRNPYFGRRERTGQTIWHFIGPVLAYFFLVYIGFQILHNHPGNVDFEISIALILLFINGIRNSWNLVLEMTFDRRKKFR